MTVTKESPSTVASLPGTESHTPIRTALSDLRRRISRYVLIEGAAVVLTVTGLAFWVLLGIDWAWFGFRRLELPRWFRTTLVAGSLIVVGVVFLRHVFRRLSGRYQERDLALVLERRFPELNDSLITAVEMPGSSESAENAVTSAMIRQTVARASDTVNKLPLSDVFAARPLRIATIAAGIMLASVLGLGAARGDMLRRWWNAFVLHKDNYWERETRLRVRAIVQPGDRVREFRSGGDCLELLHPRNTDLTIVIESDDSSEQSWRVPDRVRLDVRRTTDSKRVYLSRLPDDQFRYSIDRLSDDIEFDILGGDFANRIPFRVRVVDAPRVDAVALDCKYPDYTGWDDRRVTLTGSRTDLPFGTAFELEAEVNKPLIGFHLEAGELELTLEESEAVLTYGEEGGPRRTRTLSDEATQEVISGGRKIIRLPLQITGTAQSQTGDRIHIPPDTLLKFYLHDADDIMSAEPIVIKLVGLPDQPPSIEDCTREGVGEAITRKAVIPIRGLIRDDYGVANARFEFRVDDEQAWRPRRFRRRVHGAPTEFRLQGREGDPTERFNVTVLGLEEGQRLTLSVFAEDADNLSGPNIGRSQKFAFRIVSNEELLSLLYAREINLRRRFEEVVRQIEAVRRDLNEQRTALAAAGGEAAPRSVTLAASQAFNAVQKNANESLAVEAAFREIVEELINNAIPPKSLADEMRLAIVQPLTEVNRSDFPTVDDLLDVFRLASERNQATVQQLDRSLGAIDQMLRRMRDLLDEIKQLAELHEIVKDLKQLIDGQEDLLNKTKALQKRKLIEKLRGLGGDDDE